tara:strand:+ start:173 stop:463 length:291 start_codon:yes stop_codon:yes gene_type:complete
MARKVVSRKALRAEAEAAGEPKAKKAKKPAAKRTRTKKAAVEIRMKAFWGVFNQSLKRVALYEFSQKKQAEKKAQDLSSGSKGQHFVQRVKEEITE